MPGKGDITGLEKYQYRSPDGAEKPVDVSLTIRADQKAWLKSQHGGMSATVRKAIDFYRGKITSQEA